MALSTIQASASDGLLGGRGGDGSISSVVVSVRPRSRSSISRRDAAKNSARGDSSPSRSRARICRCIAWMSRASQATCKPPQVRLQPGVGVEHVRGDVVEPGGQGTGARRARRDPSARPGPRRGQSAISSGVADPPRPLHRLVGELRRRGRLAGVRPAAGERRREPRPCARRRWCGPARRTAARAACPARRRTGSTDAAPSTARVQPVEVVLGPAASRPPRRTGERRPLPRPAARAASARSRSSRRLDALRRHASS